MLDDADDSELLKTSAALIMDLKNRVDELEKRAEKKETIDHVMEKLDKESMVGDHNRAEKRAALEERDLQEIKNIREVLDNFVKNAKFKIGSVRDSDYNNQLDPFESWLLEGDI